MTSPIALLPVMALLFCRPAMAQSPPSPVPPTTTAPLQPVRPKSATPARTLQTVTVIGRYDHGVGASDAASEGLVLGQLLHDIPLLRPGELLETMPGPVFTHHSGDGNRITRRK